MVHWQMQKSMCYCAVFAFFNFEFEDNFQVQAPRGLYLEGRLILLEGFLCYEFGGLYLKGLIFGILRYLDTCGKSLIVMIRCSSYLVY